MGVFELLVGAVLVSVAVGAAGLVVAGTRASSRGVEQAWREAGQILGIEYRRANSGFSLSRDHQLRGELDGVRTLVETFTSSGESNARCTRVVVICGRHFSRAIRFASEGAWQNFKKVFTGEDILCHDPRFDRDIYVEGPEPEVIAVLNHTNRQAIRELVTKTGAVVRDGKIKFEEHLVISDSGRIVTLVRAMTHVAALLSRDIGETSVALRINAAGDPIANLRLNNLKILCERFPQHEATWAAARAALDDNDERLRVLGAEKLLEEGFGTLAQIVEADTASTALRIRALNHLAANFYGHRVLPSIEVALASEDSLLRCAAVRAIGSTGNAELLERVCDLAASIEPAIAEAAAETLGKLGDQSSEGVLVGLLSHEQAEVRIAAVTALGAVGTVNAVEPLLSHTKGGLGGGGVKKAARAAVEYIQGRLVGAEAARLSLAPVADETGALSLAGVGAGAEGELSLADDAAEESSGT